MMLLAWIQMSNRRLVRVRAGHSQEGSGSTPLEMLSGHNLQVELASKELGKEQETLMTCSRNLSSSSLWVNRKDLNQEGRAKLEKRREKTLMYFKILTSYCLIL
jgi:hypothetical protein